MRDSRYGRREGEGCGLVVVDHLEYHLTDGDLNRAKLALLERLVLKQNAYVVVLSEIDPVQYFCNRLQSPGDDKPDERSATSEEIDRWAAVLECLLKVAVPLAGAPAPVETRIVDWIKRASTGGHVRLHARRLEEWQAEIESGFAVRSSFDNRPPRQDSESSARWKRVLGEECRWTPRLRGIAVEAAHLLDPPTDAMARTADLTRAHYRALWVMLTDQERLVLYHLASNGFANPNPRNWPVVRRLADQGLIRRTPALRLMNQTFARFVQQVETEEQVSRWERAAGPSAWSRIRGILVIASIVIGALLFQTQPQLLTYIAGGLAAAAGLAATVSNLLGFFQGRQVAPPPKAEQSAPS